MAWTHVEAPINAGRSTGTTQLSAAFGASAVNDLLVCVLVAAADAVISSIGDTQGATWNIGTPTGAAAANGARLSYAWAYANNTSARGIDINISADVPCMGYMFHARGGVTSGAPSVRVENSSTSAGTTLGLAVSPSVETYCITLFGGGNTVNYGPVTQPTSYTETFENTDASSWLLASDFAFRLAQPSGAATLTWTSANVANRVALVIGWGLTAGDTTPPTYGANPAASAVGTDRVTISATASDAVDTAVDHYVGIYATGNTPTAANIKAGTGTGLVAGTNKSALNVANGVSTNFGGAITGLSSATGYDAWAVVEEHGSTKNTSAPFQVPFTTLSALTSPLGAMDATTGTTGNTASGGVTVSGGSGVLYWYLSNSGTPPSAVDLKAGTSSLAFGNVAVSGAGAKTFLNKGSLAEKTNYWFHYLHTFASQDSAISSSASFQATDAPTLSSATGTVASATSANLSVATNRTAGTAWVVVTTSTTKPTAAQIKAGQDNTGAAAAYASSDATVSNPQLFTATGLTSGVGYFAHFYQEDGQSDGSNIITSNSFTPVASGVYNIDGFSPAQIRPGATVTANISGNWSGVGMNGLINGHPVTLTAQSATQVQFTCPTFHTNATYADTPYNTQLVFQLNDGSNNQTKGITVLPPSGYDFVSIGSVSGIWADDTGAAIGDDHLGHFTAGAGNSIGTDGIISGITGFPATYQYWRFDKSETIWTAAASEIFYEMVAFGTAYNPQQYWEGVAITSFDGAASFNASTSNISAYAEVGQAVPGLSLNTSTGALTGTPTTQGSYTYTIRATDSDGNTAFSNSFTITVYETPVWSSTPANQSWQDGQVVSLALASFINANTFGPASSWSKLAGTLPTGVTLNTASGIVSGTVAANASVSSPYNGLQFRATNTAGNGDSGTFNITVLPIAPVFSGLIANISIGSGAMTPVDVSSNFSGNGKTFSFSGAVPTGITIDSSSGIISGTPSTFGTFANVRVLVTNASGSAQSNLLTITAADAAPTFTGNIADIGPLSINAAMTPVDVSGQFGGGAGTFSISSAAQLHPGITINSAGVISGTPTVTGNRTGLKVRKTNTGGFVDSNAFGINVVGGAPVLSTPLPDRTDLNGTAISVDFRTYFTGAVSVAVTGLPHGLTDSGGVVSGTLTTVETVTVTVTATNASGSIAPTFSWAVGTLVPTLSSPVSYQKATSALIRSTTDRSGGTLYAVVTTSATPPSIAQIKAGQNNAGGAAVFAANAPVTYVGEQTFNATGLSALTTYYVYWVQNVTAGDSNRSASPPFATTSGTSGGGPRWFDF